MSDAPHPRTLTHARLRRAQGDTRGAIAILEALIDAGEEGEDLWQLYLVLGGDRYRPHSEPELAPVEEPRPAGPAEIAEMATAFQSEPIRAPDVEKVRRLERWLTRMRGKLDSSDRNPTA